MSSDTLSRVVDARYAVIAIAMAGALSACSGAANPVSPDSTAAAPTTVNSLSADATFCVEEVNRLRATVGAAPLDRAENIEAFANVAARVDTEAREPHHYFRMTNGGNGTAMAETQIPWWPLSRYGSSRTIVKEGLAMMWAQGPGGSHYDIIRGNYKQIGCGVFVTASGEVTVSQDFH